MSGFGAGIRRGVMAADQFTQIANGLFRDSRRPMSDQRNPYTRFGKRTTSKLVF